ncbi:hypothetical protein CSA80_00635 [Candidatus Saccharibacteria bacterium]|nr:MAG: hypothetical protein CSA80_00635 [Candidatus Saccharibacteria bacterium]
MTDIERQPMDIQPVKDIMLGAIHELDPNNPNATDFSGLADNEHLSEGNFECYLDLRQDSKLLSFRQDFRFSPIEVSSVSPKELETLVTPSTAVTTRDYLTRRLEIIAVGKNGLEVAGDGDIYSLTVLEQLTVNTDAKATHLLKAPWHQVPEIASSGVNFDRRIKTTDPDVIAACTENAVTAYQDWLRVTNIEQALGHLARPLLGPNPRWLATLESLTPRE